MLVILILKLTVVSFFIMTSRILYVVSFALYYKNILERMKVRNMQSTNKNKTTKEKIFYAAVELFAAKGYNAVSIREITNKVGIKESSLYNHFRSKESLLDEIFDYFQGRMEEIQPSNEVIDYQMSILSPEMFFQQIVFEFDKKIDDTMDNIFRIIFMEQFRNERARKFVVEDLLKKQEEFYFNVFQKMMDRNIIPRRDAKKMASTMNHGFFSISLEYNLTKLEKRDLKPVFKKMIDHIQIVLAKDIDKD